MDGLTFAFVKQQPQLQLSTLKVFVLFLRNAHTHHTQTQLVLFTLKHVLLNVYFIFETKHAI